MPAPTVLTVSRDGSHRFSKPVVDSIRLLVGLGVEGDAHCGSTVQHRWDVRHHPERPNLRQVHLMHAELHADLTEHGFDVAPGAMGENVTTRGVDLLALPTGTTLRLGADAVVEITGLRHPCILIDRYQHGLLRQVIGRAEDGSVVRKAGVMAVVVAEGVVRAGAPIGVELPAPPHRPLVPV